MMVPRARPIELHSTSLDGRWGEGSGYITENLAVDHSGVMIGECHAHCILKSHPFLDLKQEYW